MISRPGWKSRVRRGGTIRLLAMAVASLGLVGAPGAAGSNDPIEDMMSLTLSNLSLGLTNQPLPAVFQPEAMVAQGFRSPDGIVLDAETGDLYVTDEDAAAIYRIRPNGTKRVVFDASTPIYEVKAGIRKPVGALRSPEGMALDAKGTLYVVEDIPGGRLIAFDIRGKAPRGGVSGEVVPIPIRNSRFAWESVDVHTNGALLIAGSTMESVLGRDGPADLFRGVVLYRDTDGNWWLLLNHAMTSYSAACFSRDGDFAFFVAEVPGIAGCVDLRTRLVRTYLWDKTFRSPEGVCALPGGSFLVAEESGRIFWMDPTSGAMQLLYENVGTIESVLWDDAGRRLLFTDDRRGQLVALELKKGGHLRRAVGKVVDIPFMEESTPVEMVPERCPDYLAQILKLGGYDPVQKRGGIGFQDFAKRYCLVAIDANAQLMPGHKPVEDPIQRIQFVVIAPYLIGYQEGELLWSSSGFTVIKESGQMVKTELVKRQVIHGDLMESRFTPVGGPNIALPMPFSARINTDGHVAVNFLGMGVMADFYLVLDSTEPDNSVMVVVQPDGFVHQYQINLPPNKDSTHWVIALERKGPDSWKSLSFKR
jgi:hypothetical protein